MPGFRAAAATTSDAVETVTVTVVETAIGTATTVISSLESGPAWPPGNTPGRSCGYTYETELWVAVGLVVFLALLLAATLGEIKYQLNQRRLQTATA